MTKPANIIIFATFFYLFLSPFFFHPDLKIIYHHSQFLSAGVVNIYSFLAQNPEHSSLGQFVYPPLTYLVFGILFPVVRIFAGSEFTSWLAQGNTAVVTPFIFRYLFLLKLPLVLVHLYTGYLISRFFKDQRDQALSLSLWYFNPISIYTVAIIGQFDIFPVFFTVASLALFHKKKFFWSVVCLGLGASLKTYPLLLLPFVSLAASEKWPRRIGLFIAGLVPYLIFITPFIRDPNFITNVLASGLSQRLFSAEVSIGFDKGVMLVPAAILVLFFHFANQKEKMSRLPYYLSAVLLVALSVSHFHPQWVLWALPFVVILLTKRFQVWPMVLFSLSWVAVLAFFPDNFLLWGVLSPLEPQVFSLPSIISIMPDTLPWQNLAQTFFAAASIWLAVEAVKHHE